MTILYRRGSNPTVAKEEITVSINLSFDKVDICEAIDEIVDKAQKEMGKYNVKDETRKTALFLARARLVDLYLETYSVFERKSKEKTLKDVCEELQKNNIDDLDARTIGRKYLLFIKNKHKVKNWDALKKIYLARRKELLKGAGCEIYRLLEEIEDSNNAYDQMKKKNLVKMLTTIIDEVENMNFPQKKRTHS